MDKTVPDVLRVTEFVLEKAKIREEFSVSEAAKTDELNGINVYRIAEILSQICLEPNGPNSMRELTTVDSTYSHSNPGNWTLSPEAYFGYLSYQSNLHAEKANKNARNATWVALVTLIVTLALWVSDKFQAAERWF
ncbi:hypothetical protein F0237_01200 [Vibrio tubiashii]|uniref:Uncharacterized protein n=1 Tax=Vibrio tubiashii TaxID=29498 RepID=A0AAE5GMF7_9VIBR|nr:hypothetical protein [Vibrio tubiashii]NOI79258.1 hypothetical protein [Vibrio tubiashii]